VLQSDVGRKGIQPPMKSKTGFIPVLNKGLRIFFSEFVRVSLSHPSQALFYGRTVLWQMAAMRKRAAAGRNGLHVPPIAIFSITNRCNLRCKGCYAQAIRRDASEELSTGKLRGIVSEADSLGVSFITIVGGEPLVRPEIFDIAGDFPRILFLIVTNGLLLEADLIARLPRQRNTIPVLSIEGTQVQTDRRRGKGVHERVQGKMRELEAAGVFFALSLTVTRDNFDVVTDRAFVEEAIAEGCRLIFYIEYTPMREGTDEWAITDSQRADMKGIVEGFRRRHSAVFIAVPWDEEESGGCLAAGRGFVHVSANGDLEPCPFAAYSDTSLKTVSLRQGLQSRFLLALRDKHDSFKETSGGCALWKNRAVVELLLAGGSK
jgi:MoaA/NifB/PqqE/SkfB family radical SAM enzyme